MRILVTGATGVLGTQLVRTLRQGGHSVRVMSRRALNDPDAIRADLRTGVGLREAVDGVEAVVHAASATLRAWQYGSVDVRGTRSLVAAANEARVSHFLYPSIVGMEGVPHPYFKPKLAAEQIVAASQMGWTILRATQFYSLFCQMIELSARSPLLIVPKRWTVQPIDPADVAAEFLHALNTGPSGRWPDFGGPQVRTLGDMAEAWVKGRGSTRRVRNLPLPGRISRPFSNGQMTCPNRALGTITWEQWLDAGQLDSLTAKK